MKYTPKTKWGQARRHTRKWTKDQIKWHYENITRGYFTKLYDVTVTPFQIIIKKKPEDETTTTKRTSRTKRTEVRP